VHDLAKELKTPENFFASNEFNGLRGDAPPKINDLQTFPEFSGRKVLLYTIPVVMFFFGCQTSNASEIDTVCSFPTNCEC